MMENEADHEKPKLGADYQIIGDWKYADCGFMKIFVPKNTRVGSNRCICCLFSCCCKQLEDDYVAPPPLDESILQNLNFGWNS